MDDIVYLDSSIWIAYMLNERKQDAVEGLLNRIFKNGDKILASTLVVLEVVEAIRKRIIERENFAGLSEEKKNEIKEKVDNRIRSFMDYLVTLAVQNKAIVTDPTDELHNFWGDTLRVLKLHFGDIEEFDYCFVCDRKTPMRYKYRGLGHYDIQHAKNAKELSAVELASTDRAFPKLNEIAEFQSLRITVL